MCTVSCSAKPGGTLQKFCELQLPIVRHSNKDVVVLQLGSNDLCDNLLDPQTLATNILSLVNDLHSRCGVKHIVVLQILHRHIPRNPAKRRRQLDYNRYNDRVDATNLAILNGLENCPFASYWRHKGLINPAQLESALSDDGVHLNYIQGYKKYLHNVRAAIRNVLHRL